MSTIWCHANLGLNLQLVLIASRVPCFGVGPRCLSSNLCVALHHQTLVLTTLVPTVWCMVELGAAFRPSQARPKSTPSVFLILSRAASPHSQTFSTHVSLNPPPTPIPDFFTHELAAGSHDHMSALHGVAASLHLHFMLGFNVRSHMPAGGCIINRIGCKYFPAQSCALPLLFFVYLHTFLLFTTLG